MADLELLHHFTVSTALTLSTTPELQNWWRIEVPNLAFSHPFVMRALLALSGIHLAHGLLAPGPSASYSHFMSAFATEGPSPGDLHDIAQSHISRALAQHTIALRTAHQLLPTTTPETCAPIYVCAVLCMLVAFTTPRGAGPCSEHPPLLFVASDGAAGPAPWLHLSRGVKAIIEQSRDSMLMTHIGVPLRMALSPRNQMAPGPAGVDDTAAAESGSEAVRALVALRGWLDEEGDICFADAAESLIGVYQTFEIAGDAIAMRAVLGWICHVDEAFLRALADRDCRALVVFAYYAVLLHWLDSGNWWINGWGRHVVTKIDAMVDAKDCQGWLRWPREQIGVWKEDYQPVDCVVI
ncbi:C6 transcription factor [Macrophomina phaseolina MS6]|uniref:C6 transcription factor n=1 Tax=Macrophomina phaseolina (strain MS6) TaxID=1126212 RepID=K2QST0_MACPH|nr:C6 transcription factor [Macrophomina phaseolina MS6]